MNSPKNFPMVAICVKEETRYHFALYDTNVTPGDFIAVNSSENNNQIWRVDEVISAEDSQKELGGFKIRSEVICKLDVSEYNKRCKLREISEEVRKKLDIEIKKFEEKEKYTMYAKASPEIVELVRLYEANDIC